MWGVSDLHGTPAIWLGLGKKTTWFGLEKHDDSVTVMLIMSVISFT